MEPRHAGILRSTYGRAKAVTRTRTAFLNSRVVGSSPTSSTRIRAQLEFRLLWKCPKSGTVRARVHGVRPGELVGVILAPRGRGFASALNEGICHGVDKYVHAGRQVTARWEECADGCWSAAG